MKLPDSNAQMRKWTTQMPESAEQDAAHSVSLVHLEPDPWYQSHFAEPLFRHFASVSDACAPSVGQKRRKNDIASHFETARDCGHIRAILA